MSSIGTKITKAAKKVAGAGAKVGTTATRLSTNPLYMVTDKLVDKVIPGYSATVNKVLTESANPFSTLNTGLTKAALNVNPVNAIKETYNVAKQTIKPTQNRVIPDRSSYSQSAGAAAAAAAANAAAAKVEAEKLRVVPDRASYSANAGANANIAANNAKVRTDEERAGAQGRGQAWDNASTDAAVKQAERDKESTDPARAAIVLQNAYPDQTDNLRYYADLARYDNMENQNLPEVVVQSDYKKYLLFGSFALLAIYVLKKLK